MRQDGWVDILEMHEEFKQKIIEEYEKILETLYDKLEERK